MSLHNDNIMFLKFCYMYENENFNECLDILNSEDNPLASFYPQYFLDLLKIKIKLNQGHVLFSTKEEIENIINNWLIDHNKSVYRELISFILAEYLYKCYNNHASDNVYNLLLNFINSNYGIMSVKKYITEWINEENLERKNVMLDTVFEKFSDTALISDMKMIKRNNEDNK